MANTVIREVQKKTIGSYCFTPCRMATIKRADNNKYWQEFRETGTLIQNGIATLEPAVPQEVKHSWVPATGESDIQRIC